MPYLNGRRTTHSWSVHTQLTLVEAITGLEARAMEGLIEVMLEQFSAAPESDTDGAIPHYHRLADTLRADEEAEPVFEQLSARITEQV